LLALREHRVVRVVEVVAHQRPEKRMELVKAVTAQLAISQDRRSHMPEEAEVAMETLVLHPMPEAMAAEVVAEARQEVRATERLI
jgi:hypothetical protein